VDGASRRDVEELIGVHYQEVQRAAVRHRSLIERVIVGPKSGSTASDQPCPAVC
jgi:hypothetical protein